MGRRHILTGAGFTHNFGGPLASEMWALIFNAIDAAQKPTLKWRLRQEFDFETVYQSVMDRDGTASEQEALAMAVETAFELIDTKTRAHSGPGSSGSRTIGLSDAMNGAARDLVFPQTSTLIAWSRLRRLRFRLTRSGLLPRR